MSAQTIIVAKTGSETKAKIALTIGYISGLIFATGLSGADVDKEIDIFVSPDEGTTWEPLMVDGSQIVLSSSRNSFPVENVFFAGFDKPTTTGNVGLYISHPGGV